MAIKKALVNLVNYLTTPDTQTLTVAELTQTQSFIDLVTANKGGFSGVDSYTTIDGVKVGRTCALTHKVYPFNDGDKEVSYFYKGGSYLIGAEILKSNARKEWEDTKQANLQELEDEMMESNITPKEWKDKVTAVNAESFEFNLGEDRQAELTTAFNGYDTKELFIEAYNNSELIPFSDYAEQVQALRDEYQKAD